MDINKTRVRFENSFPVPEGIHWSDDSYSPDNPAHQKSVDVADMVNIRWSGFRDACQLFKNDSGGVYKGYSPTMEQEGVGDTCGRIYGIRGLVTFSGHTWQECHREFKKAVDDYLKFCEEEGLTPEVPE